MSSLCCSFSSTFFANEGGGVVVILQILALLQYSLMPYFKWPSPFIIWHMFSSWYCVVAKRQTKWDMCNTFILLQIIISLRAMWIEIPLFCYKFFFYKKIITIPQYPLQMHIPCPSLCVFFSWNVYKSLIMVHNSYILQ
jgi:hypothetical protein